MAAFLVNVKKGVWPLLSRINEGGVVCVMSLKEMWPLLAQYRGCGLFYVTEGGVASFSSVKRMLSVT